MFCNHKKFVRFFRTNLSEENDTEETSNKISPKKLNKSNKDYAHKKRLFSSGVYKKTKHGSLTHKNENKEKGALCIRKREYFRDVWEESKKCSELLASFGLLIDDKVLKRALVPPWEFSITDNPESRTAITVTKTNDFSPKNTPLPRVANLDLNSRAKNARKMQIKRHCASASLCWPQQHIEKLTLCMDGEPLHDGKNALFNHVR